MSDEKNNPVENEGRNGKRTFFLWGVGGAVALIIAIAAYSRYSGEPSSPPHPASIDYPAEGSSVQESNSSVTPENTPTVADIALLDERIQDISDKLDALVAKNTMIEPAVTPVEPFPPVSQGDPAAA